MLNYINEYCMSMVTDKGRTDKGTRARIVIHNFPKNIPAQLFCKIKQKCLNNDTISSLSIQIDNNIKKKKKKVLIQDIHN